MISGLDLNQTIDYVLKNDKSENPTIWKLGLLSSYVYGKIAAQENANTKDVDMLYKIVQFGVKGIENSNIKYETENVTYGNRSYNILKFETVEQIPLDAVIDLSMKIMEINSITKDERKN